MCDSINVFHCRPSGVFIDILETYARARSYLHVSVEKIILFRIFHDSTVDISAYN